MSAPALDLRLAAIIARELCMPPERIDRIRPEARFVDDLGADSLDVIEISMAVEDEFGIEFTDREVEDLETVADLTRLVRARTGQEDPCRS